MNNSIARAITKKPFLLLCDEPTGALDYENSRLIIKLLQDLNQEHQITTIIVTHNLAFTKVANRVIHLKSGSVDYIKVNPTPIKAIELTW